MSLYNNIVKFMPTEVREKISNLRQRFVAIDERFKAVDTVFGVIDHRFKAIHDRFINIDKVLSGATVVANTNQSPAPAMPSLNIAPIMKPISDLVNDSVEQVKKMRALGYANTQLVTYHNLALTTEEENLILGAGIERLYRVNGNHESTSHGKLERIDESAMPEKLSEGEALVICDPVFDAVYHCVGMHPQVRLAVMRKNVAIVPPKSEYISPPEYENMAFDDIHKVSVPLHYTQISALKGDYLEFGTWFGRGFYRNYHLFSKLLTNGKFYAFDSFGGLSKPLENELEYSNGCFEEGSHFCNLASFKANGKLVNAPVDDITFVEGFFDQTLRGHHPSEYGLKPRSVSICYIDCDLYDPTVDVLEFVSELLEDGALIYFDDYRMARAANKCGEYDAVRRWLKKNTNFGLVDLAQNDWTTQWCIFNRYTDD